MSSEATLSYSHGASASPLLGETIGANLRRIAAALPECRGARRRADRPAVDLRGVRRRDRYARPRPDRVGAGGGRPGGHLGSELRRMGAAAVRDRQGRHHPRQHQPGVPQPRARLRAAPVRRTGAGQRRALQDQRLPGDDRRSQARSDRSGRRHLPRHAAVGRAVRCRADRRRRRSADRARGQPVLRRPDQHPVHERDDRVPEGRDAVAPQHPQQRAVHRRRMPVHRARTGSAYRCRSTTASAWCSATWPARRTARAS